jgi:hypothetical protein
LVIKSIGGEGVWNDFRLLSVEGKSKVEVLEGLKIFKFFFVFVKQNVHLLYGNITLNQLSNLLSDWVWIFIDKAVSEKTYSVVITKN